MFGGIYFIYVPENEMSNPSVAIICNTKPNVLIIVTFLINLCEFQYEMFLFSNYNNCI